MAWLQNNAEPLAFFLLVAVALIVTVPRFLKRRRSK